MSPDAHKKDGNTRLNTMLPVVLLTILTLITIIPGPAADAFGGMYYNAPIQSIVKSILSVGTLIVFLMAHEWLKLPDTVIKQGEMCIRDRGIEVSDRVKYIRTIMDELQRIDSHLLFYSCLAMDLGAPVSYTHLNLLRRYGKRGNATVL